MVAAVCNIKDSVEICRLSGGGQHRCRAAFQLADFSRHQIAGGILQAGIEIAACFQIKELAHILAGVVFIGCALVDGDLSGFAVAGGVAALYAFCFNSLIAHVVFLL